MEGTIKNRNSRDRAAGFLLGVDRLILLPFKFPLFMPFLEGAVKPVPDGELSPGDLNSEATSDGPTWSEGMIGI
jgi:hypothetical protein